jgi:hypothetical protein
VQSKCHQQLLHPKIAIAKQRRFTLLHMPQVGKLFIPRKEVKLRNARKNAKECERDRISRLIIRAKLCKMTA